MKHKIHQVLDPSHKHWVQGGVFGDLREVSNEFFHKPRFLPPPNSPINIVFWIYQCFLISMRGKILFSSITPLINYTKFPLRFRNQSIALWFTHSDHEFDNLENKSIRSCKIIFIHSLDNAPQFKNLINVKIVPILAAIKPERFPRMAEIGNKVLWVGTCVERKRPDLFLNIVELNPTIQFRLIGKGWENSNYWKRVVDLPNLEYIEFAGPLSSNLIDGCSIYLMTSQIEGGPMPLIESLAAGLYPICTNTGFVTDVFNLVGLPLNFIDRNPINISHEISKVNISYQERLRIRNLILTYDFHRLADLIESAFL